MRGVTAPVADHEAAAASDSHVPVARNIQPKKNSVTSMSSRLGGAAVQGASVGVGVDAKDRRGMALRSTPLSNQPERHCDVFTPKKATRAPGRKARRRLAQPAAEPYTSGAANISAPSHPSGNAARCAEATITCTLDQPCRSIRRTAKAATRALISTPRTSPEAPTADRSNGKLPPGPQPRSSTRSPSRRHRAATARARTGLMKPRSKSGNGRRSGASNRRYRGVSDDNPTASRSPFGSWPPADVTAVAERPASTLDLPDLETDPSPCRPATTADPSRHPLVAGDRLWPGLRHRPCALVPPTRHDTTSSRPTRLAHRRPLIPYTTPGFSQ